MGYKGPPKIIVLGIDGLEYNLIEEWRLKNIMQKAYCKLDLSDYNIIVTPPIWGSMLTGKIDEDVMKIWVRESEILGDEKNIKQKWWAKVGNILPYSLNRWIWYNISERFLVGGDPFELTANYVLDKKIPSIFQFFENSWTNGIPGYGKNVCGPLQRKLTKNAISGDKLTYKIFIMKNYKKDKSDLFSALEKKEFDFIFWYTTLLDNFGHMEMGNPLKHMMKHYLEINELVGDIKERCLNSIIYIISDHGMERMEPKKSSWGMHSDHGFFSSNTGERIEKPLQFYDLISKHKNG
jgi:hypothetical protein